MPIVIHIRCVYFNKHHPETGEIMPEVEDEKGELVPIEGKCDCNFTYPNKLVQILEIVFLASAVIIGLIMMYYILHTVFRQSE